jgi:predicted SAM-dependent methyltransferase
VVCVGKSVKVGINCGSGQRPFTSTPEVQWINVDSQAKWKPDVICDVAHLPYDDEFADYVVLHHVLEHFGCGEGIGLIGEARRVLKYGGSLLIFIPDVKALAKRWLAGEIDDYIFMVNMMGAYCGDEADRHKWHYTKDGLSTFLRQFPWVADVAFNWRPIPGADIARDWWILGAECVK